MGYDLINSKGFFRFNFYEWRCVLTLAKHYGWEPMGTVMPEETAKLLMGDRGSDEEGVQGFIQNWEGNYDSNSHQLVVKEDALNLALALMKAMEVLPDERSIVDEFSTNVSIDDIKNSSCSDEDIMSAVAEIIFRGNEKSIDPLSAINCFSGLESKKYLGKFIQYCMHGGFDIT